eukprot:jgi/Mesvir1/6314/Mv19654-RA.1
MGKTYLVSSRPRERVAACRPSIASCRIFDDRHGASSGRARGIYASRMRVDPVRRCGMHTRSSYSFMKAGRDSTAVGRHGGDRDGRARARDLAEAIVCNILDMTCRRANEFLTHNPDTARPAPVLAIVNAALRVETMGHMDRPDLEAEVAATRRIIAGLDGDDAASEEGLEEDRSGEGEEEGDGSAADSEDWTEEFVKEALRVNDPTVPVPSCPCANCGLLPAAARRWEEWEPKDSLLRSLKERMPEIGWHALTQCVDLGELDPRDFGAVTASGVASGCPSRVDESASSTTD